MPSPATQNRRDIVSFPRSDSGSNASVAIAQFQGNKLVHSSHSKFIAMDLEKVFHMKGGEGENSYSKNSSLQKNVADKVKHIVKETIEEMFIATKPLSIGIADLGCSSGPNTLSNIKTLVSAVENAYNKLELAQPPPEFRIHLNDLPTNDFNTTFQALPDLYRELNNRSGRPPSIYVAGYPGTFYGRLFPNNSIHFAYSSNCLHWLSKVPPSIYDENGSSINKKSICICERSPPQVAMAYYNQFQEDFSLFLKCRSEEVVSGGRMVLIFLARSSTAHVDNGISLLWEILYQALAALVSQGEIKVEKLESYEVHFYAASKDEVKEEVMKEGSFGVEMVETFEMENQMGKHSSYGAAIAQAVRSIQESMIAHHFGEAVLDKLFDIFGKMVDQRQDDVKFVSLITVLTKL